MSQQIILFHVFIYQAFSFQDIFKLSSDINLQSITIRPLALVAADFHSQYHLFAVNGPDKDASEEPIPH